MLKMNRHAIIFLTAVLVLLSVFCISHAESFETELLMTGSAGKPVTVCVSAPEFSHFSPFGEERTVSLNKLLRHFSLSVSLDGSGSETVLMIDSDPVYSWTGETSDPVNLTALPEAPGSVSETGEENPQTDQDEFTVFLDERFYALNSLLDDLYPVFDQCADTFRDFAKVTSASLNFTGYGKGVKRITIQLSESYIRDHFPGIPASLAKTEECRQFIESLVFSGPQKMVLLYDSDNRLLRINYDGKVGRSEESMRRVSIVWRCVRTEELKKDNLTMKTPALNGNDRYNISYERTIDLSDPEHQTVNWDMEADQKEGQSRKKISFNADLFTNAGLLKGEVRYTAKSEGSDHQIVLKPSIQKENDDEYIGTIEIGHYSGKIVTSSLSASIRLSSWLKSGNTGAPAVQRSDASDAVLPDQDSFNTVLLRRLLSLPAEDLIFFSTDIPENSWEQIVKSLY